MFALFSRCRTPLSTLLLAIGTSGSVAAQPNDDVATILAENPDPFVDVDMAAVLANYGSEGSGVPFHDIRSVALQLTKQRLVSDAQPLRGASAIVSDPTGFGFTIGLSGDYLFEFDQFVLTPSAQEALLDVLALYDEYGGTLVEISGHTDSKGSDNYNQDLSEKRAAAVSTWFTENGVDPDMITALGYGETRPVANNEIDGADNPQGRSLNRRVDIKVVTERRVNSLPTTDSEVALD